MTLLVGEVHEQQTTISTWVAVKICDICHATATYVGMVV